MKLVKMKIKYTKFINQKSGCKFCGYEKGHQKQKKGIKETIEQSIKVHGDIFDFSEFI